VNREKFFLNLCYYVAIDRIMKEKCSILLVSHIDWEKYQKRLEEEEIPLKLATCEEAEH
jgi:hypothetical protein